MNDPRDERPQLNAVSPEVQRQVLGGREQSFPNPGYTPQDYAEAGTGRAKRQAKARTASESKKPGFGYVASFVWFVIGIGFFVVGGVGTINQADLFFHSQTTTGVVTGFHRYADSGKNSCGGHAYDPVVRFTTEAGITATATVRGMHICNAPSNGATFQIRYRTSDPTDAQIIAGSNWGSPIAVTAFGGIVAFIAAWAGIGTRRARSAAAAAAAAAAADGTANPYRENSRTKQQRDRQRQWAKDHR